MSDKRLEIPQLERTLGDTAFSQSPHAHYAPYVPTPLAEPRPVEKPASVKVGIYHLSRNEHGQLCVFDGVRGTIPPENLVEAMLKAILDNRNKV